MLNYIILYLIQINPGFRVWIHVLYLIGLDIVLLTNETYMYFQNNEDNYGIFEKLYIHVFLHSLLCK